MAERLVESDRARRVARYWARQQGELGFWNVPGWERHQNLLATGLPDRSWLDRFAEELVASGHAPGLALSVGSGGGSYEPLLLERGLCARVEACDLSPELVASARRRAEARGLAIEYFVCDLEAPAFPPRRYDLILAAAVLHHVANLEPLIESLARSLKPDGWLIVYDYVGPSRFQWRPRQIEICNEWLGRLPPEYRRKRGYRPHQIAAKKLFDLVPGVRSDRFEALLRSAAPARLVAHYMRLKSARLFLEEVVPPSREQFLVTDPSEAIRSEEILTALDRFFETRTVIALGGTLAQPIFNRIVLNFLEDPESAEWVERILAHERELVKSGTLGSDFVALRASARVKEPRDGSRLDKSAARQGVAS